MQLSLKNKTVLITGSSRGIGNETAKLLAEMGARIILHYNKSFESAAKTINNLSGNNHIAIQTDFSQPNNIESFVNEAIDCVGNIDILINNAGVYLEKSVDDLDFAEWKNIWEETIAINLTSVAHLSFLLAKHMKESGGGKIINISSRGAFRGEPTALAYGASKGGLNSFGQSLAKALGGDNIFVYTIAPGFVDTDMAKEILERPKGEEIRNQSPLGRVAKPIEVAETIAFLAAGKNEFLTGTIIDVNGASYLRM